MIDFARQRSSAALLLGATFLTPFAMGQAGAQTAAPIVLAAADPAADPAAAPADPAAAPADPAAATAPPPEVIPTVDTGIGEIVVTATRSSESIQKVPISIQALGMEKLG